MKSREDLTEDILGLLRRVADPVGPLDEPGALQREAVFLLDEWRVARWANDTATPKQPPLLPAKK